MSDRMETPARGPARSVLQQALADQRERCRRGETFAVESYLERYPALRDNRDALLDLIYQEMMLRESLGETPVLAEYVKRFPALATELEIQFEIEAAIEPDDAQLTMTQARSRLLGDVTVTNPSPPAPVLSSGAGARAKDFEILEELERDTAYRARQLSLNRVVRLRLLAAESPTPDELARWRIEIEAISRLQHPNIAQVFELGKVEGRLFAVGEHVAGETLGRSKGKPWSPEEAAHLIETLARAVHYAHQQGIVHGELTTKRIVMASVPKIADLGLSGMLKRGAVVTPETDVCALGAMLRELVTGADTRTEPARLPGSVETICAACAHANPRHRYATALALAEDLRRFQTGQPILARRETWTERLWQWLRPRGSV